ncbi:MAG: aldo/keto reductase [Ardenticatenaceae bacterium]|nr:aldo/keto reductase [Ardenticatenaceae bacterium]
MKTYKIPHTDLEVSRLVYGTMHMGGTWDKTPPTDEVKSRAVELINTAIDLGINHIDLADIYTLGKSDIVVGHALQQSPGLRAKLVLQQKCGIIVGADPDFGPPGRYDFSYDHIVGSVETSLKRLHTDHFDILALHRPDALIEHEEVARAFDDLHRSGKVRYFGVSNHSAAQIELLKKHVDQPLVVNQLELSLLHHYLISDGLTANMTVTPYANVSGLLDYCRLNDIVIQAWSSVAGGRLFNPPSNAPDHVKKAAALIAQLAEKHQTTKEAVAVGWLLRHPAGIQPILGTLNSERLKHTCAADDLNLSRREWYELLEAARGDSVP